MEKWNKQSGQIDWNTNRKTLINLLEAICILVVIYISSYFILMIPFLPSKTNPQTTVYSSTYRWGTVYSENVGDSRVSYKGPTVLNSIYAPIDIIKNRIIVYRKPTDQSNTVVPMPTK